MDLGAIVALRCSGELLTVEYPLGDGEHVMAGWWDDLGEYHRAVFPVADLRMILASRVEW